MTTNDQRQAALQKANATRLHRAQLKRQLKSGSLDLTSGLMHPDLQDWTVHDVLAYACGQKPYKIDSERPPAPAHAMAERILAMAHVGHTVRVRDLSQLRRETVVHRAQMRASLQSRHRR